MMKITTVIGARPQFIKCAAVSRELRSRAQEVLIHTGQHYDANMSQVFFDQLGLPAPEHHLGVGSGSHGAQTGEMLRRIEEVLLAERPDWTLVYGDTNSTLAGALAAAKLQIPVAHVEAGLRSFHRGMPEEINRVVTDHLAQLLFCPTETAVRHLAHEGVTAGVHLVGDVMYDALQLQQARAEATSRILPTVGVEPGEYFLVTVHRAENTDAPERFGPIVEALQRLADLRPVVWPVHPRTRPLLRERLVPTPTLHIIEPVSYLDMLVLSKHARAILTDSGGLQKEAFWLQVPCVTLRDETEWVETIEAGWNRLVPADSDAIVQATLAWQQTPPPAVRLPVDVGASARVVRILLDSC